MTAITQAPPDLEEEGEPVYMAGIDMGSGIGSITPGQMYKTPEGETIFFYDVKLMKTVQLHTIKAEHELPYEARTQLEQLQKMYMQEGYELREKVNQSMARTKLFRERRK